MASLSTFASDLKPSEVKIGSLASYFDGWLLDRSYEEIVAVYGNGKVRLSSGRVKKISKIGIEVNSKCLEGVCVGDKVIYLHLGILENFESTVSVLFDNNTALLKDGAVKKLKRLSTVY